MKLVAILFLVGCVSTDEPCEVTGEVCEQDDLVEIEQAQTQSTSSTGCRCDAGGTFECWSAFLRTYVKRYDSAHPDGCCYGLRSCAE